MQNNNPVVGDPTQVEINGKRFYKVVFEDGSYRLLRSVTTICKGAKLPSFLDTWEKDQIEQIGVKAFSEALNQKALDGTIMHKFIEEHTEGKKITRASTVNIDGKVYGFDDDIYPMFEAYLEWEGKRKPQQIWNEKTLYSLEYGYAGRSDRKVVIDGKTLIVDYKSAKRPQDDHRQQGSAYYMANREMGEECDGVMILCLGQDEKRKQPYSESILTDPYEIHQHFMGFYLKNQLVNWANPLPV